jgi:hypothetical protein
MPLWPISLISLSLVAVLCLVGTFAPSYKDNLGQRIGMAILCFGCASRVQAIWESQVVSPDWVLVHFGIALYALSTAFKHWRINAREKRESKRLHVVAGKDLRHVSGGKR